MNLNAQVSMAHFNSFAVDAYADQLFKLNSTEQLDELIPVLTKSHKRLILGGGSNILLRKNFKGLVVLNQLKGIHVERDAHDSVILEVGAGENWHAFVCWALENNYYGLENLSLIPGTVGASPIQNIGAYGVEVEEYIDSLNVIDLEHSKLMRFQKHDCQFDYRDSIFKHRLDRYLITSVRYRLPKMFKPRLAYSGIKEKLLDTNIEPARASAKQISKAICELRRQKLPDPAVIGNAGSFFKNPVVSAQAYSSLKSQHPDIPMYVINDNNCKIPAAWLIEQCGFKGFRLGDAGVSQQHALVLINYGKASGEQIWQLARSIQDAVAKSFGIDLVPEPRIL